MRQHGADVYYHGDFDWPGIAIAGRVMMELQALPWRYDIEDYIHSLKAPGRNLAGTPQPTTWSPTLRQAMIEHSHACDEETLFDDLLPDSKQPLNSAE